MAALIGKKLLTLFLSYVIIITMCRCDGIGRRDGLKIRW